MSMPKNTVIKKDSSAGAKSAATKKESSPVNAKSVVMKKESSPVNVKSVVMKKESSATSGKRVVFEVVAERGAEVYVAGTFNNWKPDQKQLVDPKGNGVYSCDLVLTPGTYEYKFRVNNVWTVDQNNSRFIQNDLGTLNSVLVI